MASQRIFKFPLEVTDSQDVLMPTGAYVLSAIEQFDRVVVYARVNPEAVATRRRFFIVGTGHSLAHVPDGAPFVGTVSTSGGQLIWHVYDGGEVAK